MLHVPVPGGEDLWLEHLVVDVNGTVTDRGALIAGVDDAITALRDDLDVHALSADTFGTAEALAKRLGATFRRVDNGEDKRRYIESLGAGKCVAVGNGRNDELMLGAAALGIVVVGPEGANIRAVETADVLVRSMPEALALLTAPMALTATLRP